jgi:hypothetical protein
MVEEMTLVHEGWNAKFATDLSVAASNNTKYNASGI